jgi:hypothetical protein
MMKLFLTLFILQSLNAQTIYYNNKKLISVDVNHSSSILNMQPMKYFKNEFNQIIAVSNTILVQCHTNQACQDDIVLLEIKEISLISKSIYRVTINNSQDIFDMTKRINTLASVKYAHPNFQKKFQRR